MHAASVQETRDCRYVPARGMQLVSSSPTQIRKTSLRFSTNALTSFFSHLFIGIFKSLEDRRDRKWIFIFKNASQMPNTGHAVIAHWTICMNQLFFIFLVLTDHVLNYTQKWVCVHVSICNNFSFSVSQSGNNKGKSFFSTASALFTVHCLELGSRNTLHRD